MSQVILLIHVPTKKFRELRSRNFPYILKRPETVTSVLFPTNASMEEATYNIFVTCIG